MENAMELLAILAEKAQITLKCLPREGMSQSQSDLQAAIDKANYFLNNTRGSKPSQSDSAVGGAI